MRHVGVTGGAVLFFLLGVDVMAIFAGKALGVMDTRLVPLGRPFMTVVTCGAYELLIVGDGFDVAVAAYAGEVPVDGPFFKGLMTAETIFRLDSSMNGENQKNEDEQENQHDSVGQINIGNFINAFKKASPKVSAPLEASHFHLLLTPFSYFP